MTTNKKQAGESPRRLLTGVGLAGAGRGMCSGPGWLSVRRIADVPFEASVAVLECWRLQGNDSELHSGQIRLRRPIEHNHGSGTCRAGGSPGPGPLCPLVRVRLEADRWPTSPSGSVPASPDVASTIIGSRRCPRGHGEGEVA